MTAPLLRWVAPAPLVLAQLLEERGLLGALADGRVFVDGVRAGRERGLLPAGAVVEVFAPRPRSSIVVLGDFADVFAVHKPAALPTEPDRSGADCVLSQLAKLLHVEVEGLFAISRLDVGVSGVLLVTLGSRSRERLLAERAGSRLRRRYVALSAGVPDPVEGDWRDALGGAGPARRAVDGRDARSAHSHYRVVARASPVTPDAPDTALLALSPITGRTHQLRVHAAAHGAPLLGDRKYFGPSRVTARDGSVQTFSQILLHAAWVEWGADRQRRRVTSEPVAALVDVWLALDGDIAAIQRALD
jgi:tRNA pseudouridine32 synthase / 23S rRNA pseudouridine746 synthase